jgi:hypothetical protein
MATRCPVFLLVLLQMRERTVPDYQACLDQLLTWQPVLTFPPAAAAAADA